jgi:transposase-like protein
MTAKYTFKQFQDEYANDDACLEAIMQRRYGDTPVCPGCGLVGTKFHRITGRRAYACQWCGHHAYPCVGTPFEHSSTPLTLWFQAMYLFTATRNGVSAKELQRQLGVTYKCAWRIGHELRKLMSARDKASNPNPLKGHVEVDETFIGGVRRGKQGQNLENKTIVLGMVERGGAIKNQIVPDTKRLTLRKVIRDNVRHGSTISSDEHMAYRKLASRGYIHGMVNHSQEQWVNGIHHTNSIEGFWSHLKRGIKSTHAAVSRKHLQKYVDEFAFRYNNRQAPAEMFNRMLSQITKKDDITSS